MSGESDEFNLVFSPLQLACGQMLVVSHPHHGFLSKTHHRLTRQSALAW